VTDGPDHNDSSLDGSMASRPRASLAIRTVLAITGCMARSRARSGLMTVPGVWPARCNVSRCYSATARSRRRRLARHWALSLQQRRRARHVPVSVTRWSKWRSATGLHDPARVTPITKIALVTSHSDVPQSTNGSPMEHSFPTTNSFRHGCASVEGLAHRFES